MKETIITKIIPKTHRYIFLGFAFAFLFVFFIFIALVEGIHIDHLSFQGLKIEKLYLKWENALLIKVSKIDLSDIKPSDEPFSLDPLSKLPPYIRHIQQWVEQIDIDSITYKNLELSLHYQKSQKGLLTFKDNHFSQSANFILTDKAFDLNLSRWDYKGTKIDARLSVDLPKESFHFQTSLAIPKNPIFTLKAAGTSETFSFQGFFESDLKDIKPIVELFDLDPEVKPWIIEKARASSIHLHSLGGTFHYNQPQELLKNLYANATVIKGEYVFAEGFEPIKSPKVELKFHQGRLYIFPESGTFYGLPTEKSSLYIDFIPIHTLLHIDLLTEHAVLNAPILKLLNFYGIELPIRQTSGSCDVNLHLNVDLHTLETTAKGLFRPSSTEFLLHTVPLYSDGGIVKLENTKVTFENFTAHYGDDIAHAKVHGEYDAHSSRGIVNIDAYDVSPLSDKNFLHLNDPQQPLRITYIIAPHSDTIHVSSSVWSLMGKKLLIHEFKAPFDYETLTGKLESLPFVYADSIEGKVNALFNGSENTLHTNILLNRFNTGEVQLSHTPIHLNIHSENNNTFFSIAESSVWNVHNVPMIISPVHAKFKKEEFVIEPVDVVISDILKGRFSGKYSLRSNQGVLLINSILPINQKFSSLLDTKETLNIDLDASGQEILLSADTLKTQFSTIPNGWKISLEDISLLSKKSPILRKYHLTQGNLDLYYTPKNERYSFNGVVNYPYPLMIVDKKPITKYYFSGSNKDSLTNIRVNDRITIRYDGSSIDIKAKNMGINLPPLLDFLSTQQKNLSPSQKDESDTPIRIHTDNTYLYLMKDRKIVADTMDAFLKEGRFNAHLYHGNGSADLKMYNGEFFIDGANFNDKFMEHLFALSDFSGGTFSFQAKGESDQFEGVMRVENTILKDYKILNNVLAFINTIPSLATFSLPNYNSKGLPVQEGYAHFKYADNLIEVDNFTLNSHEMKILGEGKANLKTQILNGNLTLKTDLGSTLGKVPVVGYILLGDDGSLATTLTLSGKLNDPKVDTAITQEIITAPFNILKRTAIYPFLWMLEEKKKK